jgi:dihydroxyacetone kinase-like predicted kinase
VASAVREAETPAGPVDAGDALGIVDGEVRTVGGDAVTVAIEALRPVVGDAHEVATVLVGEGVADDDAARLVREVAASFPGLEVEVHRGDQPHYPFLIGIE